MAALPPSVARAVQYPQTKIVSENPADWTPWVDDGEVRALAQVGNRIFAGGTFHSVRAPGSPTSLTRTFLFAFDATTGAIDPTFAPVLDDLVNAIVPSPDGRSIIIGGRFDNVNGQRRNNLAMLDAATGALVPSFTATATGGAVTDMVVRGNTLYVGGRFTTINGVSRPYLAALNATTGALDDRLNSVFSGTINGGDTYVDALDVTPDGSRMVVIGNFTTIDGQSRPQIAQFDLTTNPFTLANWRTTRLQSACANVFASWVEDVDYSPDGSYFALVTTGAFRGGVNAGVMCDTASRWETYAEGTSLQPTWIDYAGGDTQVGVAVTDAAIYTAGHQRWMNSPYVGDAEGPGAVARQGLAALDPVNGLPLSWNPTKSISGGSFAGTFLATDQGLWLGTDVESIGGETHPRLAFFPLDGGKVVPPADPGTLPGTLYSLPQTECSSVDASILYRVNAGGPAIPSLDCGPGWTADTGTTNPLRNSGSTTTSYNRNFTVAYAPAGSVPITTPRDVFASDRTDPSFAPEMEWNFPVPAGTPIQVRLYFASHSTTSRRFNVQIDGAVALNNYDINADAGYRVGTMKAFNVTSDGNVDVDFIHVLGNPLINAIEIVRTDVSPGPFPACAGTDPSVLQRINAGGPQLDPIDCGPVWLADNSSSALGYPFHNTGSSTSSFTNGFAVRYQPDGPVPTSTPREVYATERWDGAGGNEMSWDFTVPAGTPIEVRLYFANNYTGTSQPGQRVFNVSVDGQPVRSNYDIVADVGTQVGTVVTWPTTSDGNVDVDFTHVTENPLINAIEIVRTDVQPLQPQPANHLVSRAFDGTNAGAPTQLSTGDADWSSARGAFMLNGILYYGKRDGNLYARPFDGTALGPESLLFPYVVRPGAVFANVTGAFFWRGLLFYTVDGDSTMHYRYFTPESGVLGAVQFNVPANGFNWAQARGLTMANGMLYWATPDGNLHSAVFADGAPQPGTDSIVSGPATGDGQRWGGRGMFVLSLAQGTDTQAPSAPTNLQATSVTENAVDLTWDPSTDNVGVTSYEIRRDGSLLATVPASQTTYSDGTVAPATFYRYRVFAKDAAGNVSAGSNQVSVTTPAPGVAFSDGFESGNLSSWTASQGMVVQSGDVFAGTYAAMATGSGSPAFARRNLASTYTSLNYRTAFKIVSQGANAVNLLRLQTAAGGNILTAFVSQSGNLMLRNDVAGANVSSSVPVSQGAWHQVEVQVTISGASSTVRVLLDGSTVNALTRTLDLGTTPIGRLILGDNSNNRTFQVAYDEVFAA
jgi:hypothetical protein